MQKTFKIGDLIQIKKTHIIKDTETWSHDIIYKVIEVAGALLRVNLAGYSPWAVTSAFELVKKKPSVGFIIE